MLQPMFVLFCMIYNRCLSLSHFLPLVQHCECILFNIIFCTCSFHIYFWSPRFPAPLSSFCRTILFSAVVFCYVHYPYCAFHGSLLLTAVFFSSVSSIRLSKGPFFRFQTYVDWLKQPSPLALPGWEPCLQRLKMVPVFGALFLAVNYYFPLSYVRTDQFLEQSIFFRYVLL